MGTSQDEDQFLMMLLKLMNAKNTLEVGVHWLFPSLHRPLASLRRQGRVQVIALDIDREAYEIGAPLIVKAGVAHKVDFRDGPAMDGIDMLLKYESNQGFFDFIFVDADKSNYLNYHKRLIKLVKVGGLIAYNKHSLEWYACCQPQ